MFLQFLLQVTTRSVFLEVPMKQHKLLLLLLLQFTRLLECHSSHLGISSSAPATSPVTAPAAQQAGFQAAIAPAPVSTNTTAAATDVEGPAGVILAAAETILMAAETILRATGHLYAAANLENTVEEANKEAIFSYNTKRLALSAPPAPLAPAATATSAPFPAPAPVTAPAPAAHPAPPASPVPQL